MVKNYRPASAGMLAALPGTYLIYAYFESGSVELVRCNVIGWQISSERTITPLVLDPRAADDDSWYVIHPDGRVESSDGRCWDSADAWVADEHSAYIDLKPIRISDLSAPQAGQRSVGEQAPAAAPQQPHSQQPHHPGGIPPVNGSRPSTPYAA
jgi:hypothetical protein